MSDGFLVINKKDMQKKGWEQLDFLFISGDAYVDHPSFSTAIIARVLQSSGYKVGIISQPDWRDDKSFKVLGKPRLGVLINAGNLDSMLNKYTAAKKKRDKDAYSPGGQIDKRPDRATIVYSNKVREIWKKMPIIIGGIEASLRRFVHYDYWSDKLRQPILKDSKADLLVCGMGERQIVEIANCLAGGMAIEDIKHINGTSYLQKDLTNTDKNYVLLPSYEQILQDKVAFARAFKLIEQEQDHITGKTLVQQSENIFFVQNKPAQPLSEQELDAVYELDFQRTYHPTYEYYGQIPAIEEVQFSLVAQRGCFGSCSFCAIHSHQGRIIQTRSDDSLIKEATLITNMKDFKGYIHDVGGPTANFHHIACKKQLQVGSCKHRHCLFPDVCPNLEVDHKEYLQLLRKLRAIKGIKKVFIRSGIRYDYILADKKNDFLSELCQHHVSGQLKVAPEHVSKKVLQLMRKPSISKYLEFADKYQKINDKIGKKQYLVPYYISSHPGSTLQDAIELAEFIRDTGHYPEQVQDFIPTPGSCATAMYYSELDPYTEKKLYVAKKSYDKAMQRALLQYRNPKNYELVFAALQKADRMDLVGFEKKCLIKPKKGVKILNEHKNRTSKPRVSKKSR